MKQPSPSTDPRTLLRRLSAPHAIAFGSRLLERGQSDSAGPNTITFREFLNVARELVTLMPEQSAIYLAALVALDMSAEDSVLFGRGEEPSAN
ncbi:MAG: hypothetical protein KDE27_03810 [Planctomycetes bacterium]|nr:hypothetical protein [Planctomycetota bacterium]